MGNMKSERALARKGRERGAVWGPAAGLGRGDGDVGAEGPGEWLGSCSGFVSVPEAGRRFSCGGVVWWVPVCSTHRVDSSFSPCSVCLH